MYHISEIEIKGFWQRGEIKCKFFDDVNIIIGKNGSGKTTFINLLINILSCDLKGLSESDFDEVTIKLVHGKSNKTIKVYKEYKSSLDLPLINFQISQKKYTFNLRRYSERMLSMRRFETSDGYLELKKALNDIINVESLSVYRLRNDDDYEILERGKREIVSPVDFKLISVMSRLVSYQLELTQEANKISETLRKEVLSSFLYDGSPIGRKHALSTGKFQIEFERQEEKNKLQNAFKQLNAFDKQVEKKIDTHLNQIESLLNNQKESQKPTQENFTKLLALVESLSKTNLIVEKSIEAESSIDRVFQPMTDFLGLLEEFTEDKKFEINQHGLGIKNKFDDVVDIDLLSSGEKQLIVLFAEALLQKNKQNIYITDEPELSLHISWQKKIIPSIIKLNPNSQIIVATHSPEIASFQKDKIISMRGLLNG